VGVLDRMCIKKSDKLGRGKRVDEEAETAVLS
jgi:hypothetical protein